MCSSDLRFHGLVCNQGQAARIRRHNSVVHAVAAYCVRLFGADKVSTKEPDLNLPGCNRKADIRVLTASGYYFADIAIVHPACSKYANFCGSSTTRLAAARKMYQKKQGLMDPVFQRPAPGLQGGIFTAYTPANRCFPIVFETSGNLFGESEIGRAHV